LTVIFVGHTPLSASVAAQAIIKSHAALAGNTARLHVEMRSSAELPAFDTGPVQ
jgi:hypothetical protein